MRRRRLQGGRCADPVWRRDRARRAAAANHARWWQALAAQCETLPSKAAAYKAGYRVGYQRAYRAWRRHLTALQRSA